MVTTAWRRDSATTRRGRRRKHRSSPQTPNSIKGFPSRRIRENDMIMGPQGGLCDGMIMAAPRKRRLSNCQICSCCASSHPNTSSHVASCRKIRIFENTQYIWYKYIYTFLYFPIHSLVFESQLIWDIIALRFKWCGCQFIFKWFDFRFKWFDC